MTAVARAQRRRSWPRQRPAGSRHSRRGPRNAAARGMTACRYRACAHRAPCKYRQLCELLPWVGVSTVASFDYALYLTGSSSFCVASSKQTGGKKANTAVDVVQYRTRLIHTNQTKANVASHVCFRALPWTQAALVSRDAASPRPAVCSKPGPKLAAIDGRAGACLTIAASMVWRTLMVTMASTAFGTSATTCWTKPSRSNSACCCCPRADGALQLLGAQLQLPNRRRRGDERGRLIGALHGDQASHPPPRTPQPPDALLLSSSIRCDICWS